MSSPRFQLNTMVPYNAHLVSSYLITDTRDGEMIEIAETARYSDVVVHSVISSLERGGDIAPHEFHRLKTMFFNNGVQYTLDGEPVIP